MPARRAKKARRGRPALSASRRPIHRYEHTGKTRVNNPQVGLVTTQTDKEESGKTYFFDPHLDPQLVWAGKAEHLAFEVPTLSLHVHERIDPKTVMEAVRRKRAVGNGEQLFFDLPQENPSLREALDFYKHPHGWSNRLIAGDSLLVMNSLLEKEAMGGQVQAHRSPPDWTKSRGCLSQLGLHFDRWAVAQP